MDSEEMVENAKGIYVPKWQTSEELQKTWTRFSQELYSQKIPRKTPAMFGMVPDLIMRKGITSHIKGLEKISGIHQNIMILLEDPLDYASLKKAVDKDNSYYMWEDEDYFKKKTPQVKQEGHLWTVGFPIVALTETHNGNDIIEIPKGHLNIFYGSRILRHYLEEKYDSFSLKNS